MPDAVIRSNLFSFSDIAVMITTIAQGSGGEVGGGWAPHMKGVGILVGNFELNP